MKIRQILPALVFFSTVLFLNGCKGDNANKNPENSKMKLAFASFGPDVGADLVMAGYIAGLKEAGFVEGKNLEITKYNAGGEMGNIPQMLKNADFKGFDVIVPLSTPCLTAALATVKNTKTVFCYVYDPVAAGAGKSFTDHAANITGVGSFPPLEETFDFIQKIAPNVKKIGTIYNTSEANSRKVIEVGKELLKKKGIELVEATVTNTSEIAQAAQMIVKKDVQVLWVTGDNTVLQGFPGVVKEAKNAKLPLVINDPEFVKDGALAAVGIGWFQAGVAGAKLALRVFKGEDPKNIPFENVAVKKITINSGVAKELGVKLPEDVLKEAEEAK
jgi:putative ABC transport system substrate-binding protein